MRSAKRPGLTNYSAFGENVASADATFGDAKPENVAAMLEVLQKQ